MYGVGDNIHQRAVVKDVQRAGGEVVLETFYKSMYHDLTAEGLKLKLIRGIEPRIRERDQLRSDILIPNDAFRAKITYDPLRIKKHGSILAAQYAAVGLKMPERPDFSLPVRPEWRKLARLAIGETHGKPVMVYRPIVLNNVWRAEARAPDPAIYSSLFRSIRERYHVVSFANIGQAGEHVVGEQQDADVNYNRGELDFETLTGLFAEADISFTCPGFAPILSQAVGTRTVIVYGANECHRTTNVVGEHLAPTLAIELDKPCDHHAKNCSCSKHITLAPALARLETFTCAS
jgi:hypothetical protein